MILASPAWGGYWRSLACLASTAARPAWRRASKVDGRQAPAPRRHGRAAVHLGHLAAAPADLVSQWQIIALRHGSKPTAALVAPFAKDAQLFSIISARSCLCGLATASERH